MKWVTWQDVGVDRMGCAWLIRRFIDPAAEFRFLAPGARPLPEGAEPFDIPGTRLSHHRGHSSFHTIVQEYGLDDPILRRIAQMVDEADVTQEVMVEPAAPGLDLICRGLRLASPDDQVALDRGRLVYDALYAALCADPGS
jgi:hypothetical protein